MEDKLLKKTAVFSIVFTVLSMSIMILFFFYRDVPVNAEEMAYAADTVMDENYNILNTKNSSKETNYLCIPLPENLSEEQVTIAENFMKRTLSLSIQGVPEDFYYRHSFGGCSDHIETLLYGYGNETARVDLILDSVYEYEKVFENGNLYLKFILPREKFPEIVVIDPGHGGASEGTTAYGHTERDLVLNISQKVKERLDEAGIQSYLTRTTNEEEPDVTQRLALAESVSANLLVSVHVNADVKTRVTNGVQVLYSNTAVQMLEANCSLAEDIEAGMVQQTQAKSQGCVSQNGIRLLQESKIPAVYAEAGYLTNRKEATMLGDEKYQEKLAQGICDGIVEALKNGEKHE